MKVNFFIRNTNAFKYLPDGKYTLIINNNDSLDNVCEFISHDNIIKCSIFKIEGNNEYQNISYLRWNMDINIIKDNLDTSSSLSFNIDYDINDESETYKLNINNNIIDIDPEDITIISSKYLSPMIMNQRKLKIACIDNISYIYNMYLNNKDRIHDIYLIRHKFKKDDYISTLNIVFNNAIRMCFEVKDSINSITDDMVESFMYVDIKKFFDDISLFDSSYLLLSNSKDISIYRCYDHNWNKHDEFCLYAGLSLIHESPLDDEQESYINSHMDNVSSKSYNMGELEGLYFKKHRTNLELSFIDNEDSIDEDKKYNNLYTYIMNYKCVLSVNDLNEKIKESVDPLDYVLSNSISNIIKLKLDNYYTHEELNDIILKTYLVFYPDVIIRINDIYVDKYSNKLISLKLVNVAYGSGNINKFYIIFN